MKNGAKISLIEYGAGNLPSVERALARQGVETERAGTPESVAAAPQRAAKRTIGTSKALRAIPRTLTGLFSAVKERVRNQKALTKARIPTNILISRYA